MSRTCMAVLVMVACRSPSVSQDASTDADAADAAENDAPNGVASCTTQATCTYGYPDPNVIDVGWDSPIAAVAIRDFDGDGIQDVLATSAITNAFVVVRGLGGGEFAPPATYTGSGTHAAAVGDFDGNGTQDLVSFAWSNGVVHSGQSAGTFVRGPTFSTSTMLVSNVMVANLNGDALPDLVGIGLHTVFYEVFTMVNTGNLTFGSPTFVSGTENATSITVGNLRGDSTDELIIARPSNVLIATNLGTGVFETPIEVPITSAGMMQAIDIDRDSDIDLVVGTSSGASVIRNLGTSFSPPELYWALIGQSSFEIEDVNNDGWLDYSSVFVDADGPAVAVRFGEPDGTFGTTHVFAISSRAELLPSVDLTGDGLRDLVLQNEGLVVFLRQSAGPTPFRSYAPYSGEAIRNSALVDIDGDADLDVVSGTYDGLRVARNIGGRLQSPQAYGSDPYSRIAGGDVSNDGRPDVVALGDHFVEVRLTTEAGTIGEPQRISTTTQPVEVAIADLDGDPYQDIVVGFRGNGTGGGIGVLRGGPGGSAPIVEYAAADVASIATGDIDNDGDTDLVLALWTKSMRVAILRNMGGGAFGPAQPLDIEVTSLALADLDCDGYLDIAGLGQGAVLVARGTSTGFSSPSSFSLRTSFNVRAADLDGDGDIDLVCNRDGYTSKVTVLDNRGDATFVVRDFSVRTVTDLDVGDLDGDGALDIIASHETSNALSVLTSTCH